MEQSTPLRSKAIGTAGVVLAIVLFLASASSVTQRRDPGIALELMPINSIALVRAAEVDFAAGSNARTENPAAGRNELARAEAMARRSLAGQPLNPRALRILALSDPQSATTQTLLEAGNAQSRRDTLTQIYLIEFAANRGEIGVAMDHYDAVLRRRSTYRDPAGRNLAAALALPGVLDEVAEQLLEKPSWESLLYFYVLQTPESYQSFMQLHRMLADTDTIPTDISAQFAQALAAQGQFDNAIEIARFASSEPLSRSTALVENSFTIEPQLPGSWIVPDSADAFLQSINGGGGLLSLSSGATGILAYRLIALERGNYAASIDVTAEEGVTMRRAVPVEARLSCAKNANVTPGSQTIAVTDDCRFQWLTIYLTETQSRAGDIFIDSITIKPEL